jgi:prefoldin subunit 5
MTDPMIEILTAMQASLAEMKADQDRNFARLDRSITLLRQDVTSIRNKQIGWEAILDDVQDHMRRIAEGMEALRPPAVPSVLGEGRPSELRQLHSEFNALQRKTAELQARIEVLEGTRER